MSVKEVSMGDLEHRKAASMVKQPTQSIQSDDDIHFQFKKVLYRFLQEFGQSTVTFEHKLPNGEYKISMGKKAIALSLTKDKKKNDFEYSFKSEVLKKNKLEMDGKHFVKFIQLTRKIIIDILKNDVKYY